MLVSDPQPILVPGVRVEGPTDPTGAGDSATAGAVLALAAGAALPEAALVGNLVASITVEQLATTGTASPEQLPPRLADVAPAAVHVEAIGVCASAARPKPPPEAEEPKIPRKAGNFFQSADGERCVAEQRFYGGMPSTFLPVMGPVAVPSSAQETS